MLSKREKIIAIVTAVILTLFVCDKLIFTPAMDKLGQLEIEKEQLIAELDEAANLFNRRKIMERKWHQFAGDGLKSESEAESHVLHSLKQWAQISRFTLTSVKPHRLTNPDTELQEMTFSVAGTGSLQATAQFIWQVERSLLPIRIKNMQLGSANESGDNMSLQLGLSALYTQSQEVSTGDQNDQKNQS